MGSEVGARLRECDVSFLAVIRIPVHDGGPLSGGSVHRQRGDLTQKDAVLLSVNFGRFESVSLRPSNRRRDRERLFSRTNRSRLRRNRRPAAWEARRAVFHGYYRDYCYLPLYVFCGDFCLAAVLRRSNISARRPIHALGSPPSIEKSVARGAFTRISTADAESTSRTPQGGDSGSRRGPTRW